MSASCPTCRFLNSSDASYCGRCGTAMGRRCPACGTGPLGEDLRYCTVCGAEMGRPARGLERKVVTVLFVDLVGFTPMAEELDPEDVREVLDRYYATVRTELERYGGTVEKFVGDAVMALFGAPYGHEDDPERAVRAAWAVREAVAALGAGERWVELHVRVGITTGEAVVAVGARPEEGEAMAHGDVVNTAARLQAGAPVDAILVDERTYRATRFQIDFREAPTLRAKGKARPIPVWEVVTPRGRTGTDRFRRTRPLVGRERELEALEAALSEAVGLSEPRLVTLVGAPGIGKSRLVWELFERLEGREEMIFWRQARALPYGDGVTFWALAEIVKAHAGILATDSVGAVEEKLRIAVEDALPEAIEARWVESHLAPLAGLSLVSDLRGDRRSEAFAAWRRFLEAVAARRPLILVFEDLHWADDGLLDFVADHLGERFDGALLVAATCRPELLDRRSGWGAGRHGSTTLQLEPLSDDDTARLVVDLLEAPDLPEELHGAVTARAGGNPLYAEEYVQMLRDRGLLQAVGASWRLSEADLPLPESVHAIVAARLDALPPDEKSVLHDAAVVGKGFWLGALSAVGGQPRWSAENHLYSLERKQLVRRERDSIVQGEPQFSFSHGIVRDVAYGQIPRSMRAGKHRRAAEWIESLSVERSVDRAEMLAHHYLSALEYARASGQDTDVLIEPARFALRDVGDRALSLNTFAKAARYYEDALELWPPTDPGRTDLVFRLGRARLHAESAGDDLLVDARDAFLAAGRLESAAEATVLVGELLWTRGEPEAFGRFEEAAALLECAPPSAAKAYVLCSLARFATIADENKEAIEVGLEALAMAEELGLEELRAHALGSIGRARIRSGDPEGMADLEESIAVAVGLNSLETVRGYANLGNALVEAGDLQRAFELYEEGRRAATRFGDADRIRWFDAERLYECYWRGSWDDAVQLAEVVLTDVAAGLATAFEQDARLVRGRIHLAQDRQALAVEDAERALELGRRAGYPEMVVPALALHARVLESVGRADEAESLLDELLAVWPERCPSSYWLADVAFTLESLGAAERLREAGRAVRGPSRWLDAALAVAAVDFGGAVDLYATVGSLPDEAFARLLAARQAGEQGARERAERELRIALDTFRRLGAARFVRGGEALLALPGH
jgi:class 3 adenylate cyclase/tetratricopeptide (TPR) repeat protein